MITSKIIQSIRWKISIFQHFDLLSKFRTFMPKGQWSVPFFWELIKTVAAFFRNSTFSCAYNRNCIMFRMDGWICTFYDLYSLSIRILSLTKCIILLKKIILGFLKNVMIISSIFKNLFSLGTDSGMKCLTCLFVFRNYKRLASAILAYWDWRLVWTLLETKEKICDLVMQNYVVVFK